MTEEGRVTREDELVRAGVACFGVYQHIDHPGAHITDLWRKRGCKRFMYQHRGRDARNIGLQVGR
jgi:hypothetical protein